MASIIITALIITEATIFGSVAMPPSSENPVKSRNESDYLNLLSDVFRQDGWKVQHELRHGLREPDLIISRRPHKYVVELKAASEGRRDRLIPLLSQAILQARAIAKSLPSANSPLAVVAAPEIPPSVVDALREFVQQNAPDAAFGVFDQQGLRFFVGPGLESLNRAQPPRSRRKDPRVQEAANLFSDLNQWMLKVLLAPRISPALLSAPRAEYRNASQLAAASDVSVMSAFRLLRQLRQDGFLDDGDGILRLVRREELMRRWQAPHLRAAAELPLRWILPVKDARKLAAVLRKQKESNGAPRLCVGSFAAAELLDMGFVHGVPPSLYMEELDQNLLQSLGLSAHDVPRVPDVVAKVPLFRESVFRAKVICDGVPVSDVLQVWLDVYSHPSRGKEQAEKIRHRALKEIF